MINLDWVRDDTKGYTLEQIERARDQQSQVERAGYQQTVAQIPALRAQAAELISVLVTGPGVGELQQALGWLDSATDAPHVAGAVQALRSAVERWAYGADLVRDMNRLNAPALAADAQRRAAEERARPKVLTIEQRLDRIEKQLGLS